jgi:hypothetical protein
MEALRSGHLSTEGLITVVREIDARFERDFQNGDWKKTVRGRDVLKAFVSKHTKGINYESFRNLVISRMRDHGYQPHGMKQILGQILAPTPIPRT